MKYLIQNTTVKFVLLVFGLCLKISSHAQSLQDITIVTEESPPYIASDSKGNATGILADRVNHICQLLNIKSNIQIFPWARAYELAKRKSSTMIFPIARNPERDALFVYAGVIYNTPTYFYKLKSRTDIQINTLEEAKKYLVGAIRKDIRHSFLLNQNFPKIMEVVDSEANMQKLITHKVELILSNEVSVKTILKKFNENSDRVEKIFLVKELDGKRYLAFKKDTPSEIVSKIKETVEKEYSSDQ